MLVFDHSFLVMTEARCFVFWLVRDIRIVSAHSGFGTIG